MSRILTLGTFDLFHVGHLELLRACRRMAEGGAVVAAVNSDEFVQRYKGKAPVVPLADRMEVVAACRYVDGVVVNADHEGQRRVISSVAPDIIAVGYDWKDRDYLAQVDVTREWLDERRIRVVYVPRTTGESSTDIRARA